uniref:Uncharacterized protein n=1 Tax=Anguilla anguilla TaxID=7936 RepID=A0A0E9UWB3_ANGAN
MPTTASFTDALTQSDSQCIALIGCWSTLFLLWDNF